MQVTILNENLVYRRGLMAEHGLSLLLEDAGGRWLFDTAQSGIFLHNARALGADVSRLDGIVLSHGHYDHCGGLEAYAAAYPLPTVYLRSQAFADKRSTGKDNSHPYIGIPWNKSLLAGCAHFTADREELAPNVWVLGNIPYVTDFEDPALSLFVQENGALQPDTMPDEQMLVIRGQQGLHVFLGCSHPGVINALCLVEKLFPGEKIDTLLAGMHLLHAGQARLERTLEELAKRDIRQIIPVHCTGQKAIAAMENRLGARCCRAQTGTILRLE